MSAVRRLVTAEDAVADGMALALRGVPFRDAAAEIWARGLTPDAVQAFAVRGIAAVLNDRMAYARESWAEDEDRTASDVRHAPQPTARGRLSVVGRHYARDHWERVLTAKNWEGADGRRKALLDFTLADAAFRLGDLRARITGYERVAAAMALAVDLLTTHKADTVAALPVKAKVAIAEAVA